MDFVPLLAVITLIYTIVNVIKQLQGGQVKEGVTQILTWIVAVLLIALLAQSDFATSVKVGEWVLGDLNFASLVIFAMSLAGGANVLYDVIPKETPTLGTTATEDATPPAYVVDTTGEEKTPPPLV